MLRLMLTIFITGLISSAALQAQSLERKVFSSGGTTAGVGGFNYSYTFGEPMIGTKMASIPHLTIGFQQPEFNQVLPVSLIEFTARRQEDDALVTWTTLWELNTSFFVVERSFDGENFHPIGNVDAGGSTFEPLEYRFTDPEIRMYGREIIFYRLRIVDLNGAFSFSQLEELILPAIGQGIVLYPNPAENFVYITAESAPDLPVTLVISNQLGQGVFQQTFPAEPGLIRWYVSLGHLAKGTYLVRVNYGKGQSIQRLILK